MPRSASARARRSRSPAPRATPASVYEGLLEFERKQIELDTLPKIPVKIMMNVGNPDRAFDFAAIPHKGVGLARLEFIINRMIGVHPRALLDFDRARWRAAGPDPHRRWPATRTR